MKTGSLRSRPVHITIKPFFLWVEMINGKEGIEGRVQGARM